MNAAEPGVIHGIVTDDAGQPVADVVVAVAAAPGPVADIAALTGPDGRFAITAPVLGRYTIVATAPDSRHGTIDIDVDGSATTVEVRVTDGGRGAGHT